MAGSVEWHERDDGAIPPPPPPPPPPAPERPEVVGRVARPASVGARVGAACIDLVPVAFIAAALSERNGANFQLENARLGLWLLAFLAYSALMEIGGQSLGKRMLGLRVVDRDTHESLSFSQGLKRTVLRPVDLFPFAYLVGFVAAVSDVDNRRFGDRWADTVVIHDSPGGFAQTAVPVATAAVAIVGSIAALMLAPGPQVGSFDFEQDVEPFADDAIDAFVSGDADRIRAVVLDRYDADVQPFLDQLAERFVVFTDAERLSGERFFTFEGAEAVELRYRTPTTGLPRTTTYLLIADIDGRLVVVGWFVD